MATAFKIVSPAFVIRTGVPIPPSKFGAGGAIYPFAQLGVGDCFDVPPGAVRQRDGQPASTSRAQTTLCACGRTFSKSHNPRARFTIRKVDERGTIRVWRTA